MGGAKMKTKAPVNTEKNIAINNHVFAFLFATFVGCLFASFGSMIEEIIFIVGGIVLF